MLNEKLESVGDNFWLDLNRQYINFSVMTLVPFKESLSFHYKVDQEESKTILEEMEEELFSLTLKGTEKKIKRYFIFSR